MPNLLSVHLAKFVGLIITYIAMGKEHCGCCGGKAFFTALLPLCIILPPLALIIFFCARDSTEEEDSSCIAPAIYVSICFGLTILGFIPGLSLSLEFHRVPHTICFRTLTAIKKKLLSELFGTRHTFLKTCAAAVLTSPTLRLGVVFAIYMIANDVFG